MTALHDTQENNNSSDQALACMNCGKGKSEYATNYAGKPIKGTNDRYPGNASNDFLCIRCKRACEESVDKTEITNNQNNDEPEIESTLSWWSKTSPLIVVSAISLVTFQETSSGWAFLVGIAFFFWGHTRWENRKAEFNQKKIDNYVKNVERAFTKRCNAQGFHYKPEHSNPYDELMLGISTDESQILISTHDSPIKIKDILDIELSIDDSGIYKSGAEASLAGSAAGAYVFGDAGAVVGPLPTDIVGNAKISSVVLNLLMDDIDQPLIQIPFLEFQTDYFNSEAQNRIKLAEKWINIIEVMHHRGEKVSLG